MKTLDLEKLVKLAWKFVVTKKYSFLGGALAVVLVVAIILVVANWRARRKDLRASGFADKETGALWALRFYKDIYLLRFNRETSVSSIRAKFPWLKDKFGQPFVIAVERNWPRWFFIQSIFHIVAERFPAKAFPQKMSNDNPWMLLIGQDGLKRQVSIDISNISLLYLCGEAGSGKTQCANLVLKQFDQKFVISTKPFDFPELPVVDSSDSKNLDSIEEVLNEVARELEIRKSKLGEGIKHVKELGLSKLVVCFDEANILLNVGYWDREHKEQILRIISKTRALIRQGRAYGIIVMICTQKGRSDELQLGSVKDGILLVGRVDTKAISTELIDSEEACDPTLKPGVFFLRDSFGIRKIQVYWDLRG
ncbi:ATP-binding protein [Bdellovibrio sp. NC01]|uniref:ATP-binding protein n=1 Tax=Bdellovibrio sp. NC01 TaxID=2220073 RepID=UPI00143DABD3|nr:AAA family ATPase [Bdellovibrio sp. NC01]